MSPEQARGRSVDRRADAWAFGCVLYEMLSGRRPFDGTDVTDVLAAVVRDAPAFDALPPGVPPAVRRLLRRCLEKDPSRRLDSMRDARLEIDDSSQVATLEQPVRRRGSAALLTAGALLAIPGLVLLGYVLGSAPTPISAPPAHVELSVAPATRLGGPPARFDRPTRPALVVTSDGTRIVFVGTAAATSQLYVRSLDARQANAIPGTEGAHTPFLSPDSQWVGFLADGIIRKVPLAGGPVVTVADLKSTDRITPSALIARGTDFYGASWGHDGAIVFGRFADGLWQVPAAGGTPSRVTTAPSGAHRLPHHLPDGRGVLLTVRGVRSDIAVLPQGATEPRVLIESATDGRYVDPSHIVFAREGLLMAVPFDLDRLAVTGSPFALEEDVMVADGSGGPAANAGAAQFDVSRSGTLVFATGGLYPAESSRVVWVDRSGGVAPIHTATGDFTRPRLSPDGRRAAVTLRPASRAEPAGVYIADFARGALTPLTRTGEWGPLWSADGSHVLFQQDDGMGRVRVDGSAPIERLHDVEAYPHTITRDGATLLFQKTSSDSGSNIWMMSLGVDRTVRPLLNSPANESWAELSPDSKWLAYGSDSSGRFEVYVQPFPGPGQREQVSFGGGDSPLWSRNGRELFFMTRGDQPGTSRVNAVNVIPGSAFTSGTPRVLFQGRFGRTGGPTAYDVSPDGSRFLMTEYLDPLTQPVTRIHVVLNWFEELRRAQTLSQ
jgi:serine/threonine-protein kinase